MQSEILSRDHSASSNQLTLYTSSVTANSPAEDYTDCTEDFSALSTATWSGQTADCHNVLEPVDLADDTTLSSRSVPTKDYASDFESANSITSVAPPISQADISLSGDVELSQHGYTPSTAGSGYATSRYDSDFESVDESAHTLTGPEGYSSDFDTASHMSYTSDLDSVTESQTESRSSATMYSCSTNPTSTPSSTGYDSDFEDSSTSSMDALTIQHQLRFVEAMMKSLQNDGGVDKSDVQHHGQWLCVICMVGGYACVIQFLVVRVGDSHSNGPLIATS